jgi:SAM-dependent methyltransferase
VVDAELRRRLDESGYSQPGFAERYDAHRPRPPAALTELLPPLLGGARPQLVVDLGSGTGLSTRFWADHAGEVVGVEPNEAMLRLAEQVTAAPNVRYVHASAYETGLPEGCVDLVTAAQSMQWMRPERVFPEIARLLRPGGVFCAYQYFSLQTPLWEPEHAWGELLERKHAIREAQDRDRAGRWPVNADRLRESGIFRLVRETAVHGVEAGDGDRLVGLALSEGSLQTLLADGMTEEELGVDRLREAAAPMRQVPWWIGYRVWLGLK